MYWRDHSYFGVIGVKRIWAEEERSAGREWLFTTVGASPGSLFCTKNWNSLKVSEPRTKSDYSNCSGGLTVVFIHSFGICRKNSWWQCENTRDKESAQSRNTDAETVLMRDGRSLI